MKIAVAQITTDPGRLSENEEKISSAISGAKAAGAQLVVFPELALPGYNVMDLAFHAGFAQESRDSLERIARNTHGIAAIVGFIDRDTTLRRSGDRPVLYNSAALLRDGTIEGVQDKTLLPDYDIFFEDRYFLRARTRRTFEVDGKKIGIQICEDLWDDAYSDKVSRELVSLGAQIIVNLSASPFHVGKLSERAERIEAVARSSEVAFVYANLVGSFDGYEGEVVFDGRSLVYGRRGELLAQGKAFCEDLLVCDIDAADAKKLDVPREEEEICEALCLGISEYFRRQRFERAYVGLSGGIDSAVVAALAVRALGRDRVTGVTMPSHVTSAETKDDALLLAERLGIECKVRPIVAEYEAWLASFAAATGKEPLGMTRQNKQARIRGSILMEYSNEDRKAIVISTGNKTELALGYCTLYGDMCGGLAAISDVSKERIYALARYLNSASGHPQIPESIIERVPTAELEEGQTDRANLPADYPILSPLVDAIVEDGGTLESLSTRFPREIVEATIRLINASEFKRRQAAPGIRVTRRAFGVGRRIPMGHDFNK